MPEITMKKFERITTESFIDRARKVHGDKYDYSKVEYKSAKVKVLIKCKACGHEWMCQPHNHLYGGGCKLCQYKRLPQNQAMSHDQFVRKAVAIHGNKYEYVEQYKTAHVNIKIKCNTCGHIFTQRPSSHLCGCGCIKCQYRNLPQNNHTEVAVFEERCKKVHEDRYSYYGDYRGTRFKIRIFCKKHKRDFYQEAGAHIFQRQGCPVCDISRGELKIEQYLKSKKVKYEYEKKFPNCKNVYGLSFDFYLPEYNLCIEYDGEQHFYPTSFFGGKKRLISVQKNDKIKEEYCKKEKIGLLRIAFFDEKNISEILERELFK